MTQEGPFSDVELPSPEALRDFMQPMSQEEEPSLPIGAEVKWQCRMPGCGGTVVAELRWPPSDPHAPIGPRSRPIRQFVAHYACDTCGVMHAHPPKDVVGE